ncbi:MAG: tetratricopeptide repeat protein [Bacillota bacterium]
MMNDAMGKDCWEEIRSVMIRGEVDRADEQLAQIIAQSPGEPLAWTLRGACLGMQGRLDEAEACFVKALELDSHLAEAWVGIGNVHYGRGDYDRARDAYLQALRLDRRLWRAYHNLAATYRKLGLANKARTAWRRARHLEYVELVAVRGNREGAGCGTYAVLTLTGLLGVLAGVILVLGF